MKLNLEALVVCGAALGCGGMQGGKPPQHFEQRLVLTDDKFQATPKEDPAQVLVDEKEIKAVPPFKLVGVLEVEGKETERLAVFYDRVAQAGGQAGCDVVVQRDAFEGGVRVQRQDMAGRDWHRNDRAIWQFLCGINGATEEQESASMKLAVKTAVKLRVAEFGDFEPCEAYTPLGSRIRKNRVCADDPGKHAEADARSSAR
jgi:hypothetical protein